MARPSFHARQAMRKQAAARSLQEQQQAITQVHQAETERLLEQASGSTYSRLKTSSDLRREKNRQDMINFRESLAFMVASAAYQAAPIDGKADLSEGHNLAELEENSVFKNLYMTALKTIQKDNAVSAAVGEAYSRYSRVNLGETEKMSAAGRAVQICRSYSPIVEARTTRELLADGVVSNVQNFVDVLTGTDIAASDRQKKGLYESFIGILAEQVQSRVLSTIKGEAERTELEAFLKESYGETPYAKTANRPLARQTKPRSVFREVCEAVAASCLSEGVEIQKDDLLSEGIVHYTLIETLNTIGLLNKDRKQIVEECLAIREKYRK